jgi:hypothetical protein
MWISACPDRIGKLHIPLGAQDGVLDLDIVMHSAFLVSVADDLLEDIGRRSRRDAAPFTPVQQVVEQSDRRRK